MMAIKRRTLLQGILGTMTFQAFPFSAFSALTPKPQLYANAAAHDQNAFFLQIFDSTGTIVSQLPLPGRGHAMASNTSLQQLVVFARRPGDYAVVVDMQTLAFHHQIKSPAGRHFYGHGVFTKDHRWLLATENKYQTGEGVIGVYDAKDNYQRVTEFPTFGIGPHELHLLSDGKTLVVANGGIQTHPDYGRQKLNLPTMQSSLVYIDLHSEKLLGAYHLPAKYQKMSIRHISVTPQDVVALAMQYEGPRIHHYPLVGIHHKENDIQLIPAPAPVDRQMRNYCGSIVVDASGSRMAVSCPRGNIITFWSVANRQFLGKVGIHDGCGVAAGCLPGEFFISSGAGDLFQSMLTGHNLIHVTRLQQSSLRWDNHMVPLHQACP